MARVFISPLGTNKYVPCYYEIEGQRSAHPVPFVQEALLAHWCVSWTAEDRVLILCTKQAEQKNWRDGENFEKGLRARIEDLHLPAPYTMLSIPEGQNEKEIMDIFMILMDALEAGDQVYLDITHSFRSLPLLQTVILNYAKVLKDIRVERIVYGAFETLGPVKEVEQKPVEQRVAPVFDLTPYDALLDWARAVDIFQKAGRPQEIKRLMGRNLGAVFSQRQDQDQKQLARSLSALGNRLENLCLDLAAARGPKVLEAQAFDEELNAVEDQKLIPPLTPLLEILRRKVQRFSVQDETAKGFEAASWCLEHELIPQAYVLLRETILSALCQWAGHDPLDESMREGFWSGLLHVVATGKSEETWKGPLAERRDEALRVIEAGGEALKALASQFERLRDYRNDLMHAGWKTSAASAPRLLQFLQNGGLESLRTAWEAFKAAAPSCQSTMKRQAFLLLSHRLTPDQERELVHIWQDPQVRVMPEELQKRWEEVPPETASVREWIQPVLEWLAHEGVPGDLVIVQGDYGATCLVASWAFAKGLVPVYATTNRSLEEVIQPDGSVLQKRLFRHVRFRRYELL